MHSFIDMLFFLCSFGCSIYFRVLKPTGEVFWGEHSKRILFLLLFTLFFMRWDVRIKGRSWVLCISIKIQGNLASYKVQKSEGKIFWPRGKELLLQGGWWNVASDPFPQIETCQATAMYWGMRPQNQGTGWERPGEKEVWLIRQEKIPRL